jgi:hypothetical protein
VWNYLILLYFLYEIDDVGVAADSPDAWGSCRFAIEPNSFCTTAVLTADREKVLGGI